MKQFRNLLLVTAFMVLIVEGSGSNLKQHIVIDNTSNPTLHHVIRRNPEVTVNERMSTLPPREGPSQVMNFGNTSDNNGVSLSVDYGKSPEIAGPAIYVHNKGKQSVITETPAHVGWRTETKTITSLNKETGKF